MTVLRHAIVALCICAALVGACGGPAKPAPSAAKVAGSHLTTGGARYLEARAGALGLFTKMAAAGSVKPPSRTHVTSSMHGMPASTEVWFGRDLQTAKGFFDDYTVSAGRDGETTTGVGNLFVIATGPVPQLTTAGATSKASPVAWLDLSLVAEVQASGGLIFDSGSDGGGTFTVSGAHVSYSDAEGTRSEHDFSQDVESKLRSALTADIPPPAGDLSKRCAESNAFTISNSRVFNETDVNDRENVYVFSAEKSSSFDCRSHRTAATLVVVFMGHQGNHDFQAISSTPPIDTSPPAHDFNAPDPPRSSDREKPGTQSSPNQPSSNPSSSADGSSATSGPPITLSSAGRDGHYEGTMHITGKAAGENVNEDFPIAFDVAGSYIVSFYDGSGSWGDNSPDDSSIPYYWMPAPAGTFRYSFSEEAAKAGADVPGWKDTMSGSVSGSGDASGTLTMDLPFEWEISWADASLDLSIHETGAWSAHRTRGTSWVCSAAAPPHCVRPEEDQTDPLNQDVGGPSGNTGSPNMTAPANDTTGSTDTAG